MNSMGSDRRGVLSRRAVFLGLAGASCGVLAAGPAGAAEWAPDRPVEIIVGQDPGSGFDRMARLLQRIWQTSNMVSKPVSVLNKPGGSGALGWGYMNLHRGSGSYIAVVSPLLLTNNLIGNMALSYKDVTPLATLQDEEIVVAVGADSPIRTGMDLIGRLRADPQSVSIGVSGIGGQNHLAVALAAQAAGGIDVTRLKLVGFAGSGDVVTAVIGGHVQSTASPMSTVAPQVAAGRMRAIAISSDQRVQGVLSNVPTWKEQNVDSVFANWRGIVGPRDMKPDQVAYWTSILARTVETEEWKKEVEREGLTNHFLAGPAMGQFLQVQNDRLQSLMSKLGLAKV